MAVPISLERMGFRDAKGQTAVVKTWIAGAADANAQRTAANAVTVAVSNISNCNVISLRGPYDLGPLPIVYGVSGEFDNALDKLMYAFADANGALHRFQIPAPLAAVFLADKQTADQSNALIIALNTAFVTNVVGRQGQPLTTVIGGVRIRRKYPRRPGMLVKDPLLTTGVPEE